MKIYKNEQRFDSKTGKPNGFERVWWETRCDFSGRIVDASDENPAEGDWPAYYYTINIDYGDQDPCHGSGGDEYDFGRTHNVDMFQFLSEEFVVFDHWNDGSEMPAFLAALAGQESLGQALRDMRVATARRLIQEGAIVAEGLTGHDG
jgi:hypothetical protein